MTEKRESQGGVDEGGNEEGAENVNAPKPAIKFRVFGKTDVGLIRENNQDNFLVADLNEAAWTQSMPDVLEAETPKTGLLAAVCDGMGGAAAGEVASQRAVDTILKVFREADRAEDRDSFARILVKSVEVAGAEIYAESQSDRSMNGMGTTATAAGLIDGILFVGQVGDSRAYILRERKLTLVTKDQSLVNQLIEAGQLTEEEAESFEHSNIILQALGTQESAEVDLTFLDLRDGDRLMLCSDGLSGAARAVDIADAMQLENTPEKVCDLLIDLANAGGGHDNITCVVVDFSGELPEPAAHEPSYQQYPLPSEDGGFDASRTEEASVELPQTGFPRWGVIGLGVTIVVGLALIVAMMSGSSDKENRVRITASPASSAVVAEAAETMFAVQFSAAEAVELLVDDRPVGGPAQRWALTLKAGKHSLEWRQNGNSIGKREVQLSADGQKIELAIPTSEAVAPGDPVAPGENAAAKVAPTSTSTPTPAPEPAPAPAPAREAAVEAAPTGSDAPAPEK